MLRTVSGEQTGSLAPTLAALEQLAVELAQARVETIVAIGDHGQLRPEALTLAQPPTFSFDLKEFGDVVTAREFKPDVQFGNTVRAYGETNLPLITVAPTRLSYVVGIPLLLLAAHLPQVKISCFGPALLPASDHQALGTVLRHAAEGTATRIAIVAAGDLAEASETFDTQVKSAVAAGDLLSLAKQTQWADAAQGIAWRSLLTLGASLSPSAWRGEVLAYQDFRGAGLLTAALRP
jgi:aromatic ring-opening dioxygenase catalytic subunit (LigB family)